jgi:predicted ribosome quality control (RQC) complex YloA/Tae2 family protein
VLLLSIAKGASARNTTAEADSDEQDLPIAEVDQDDESLEPLRCELIVEAMERRGNIILVGDDNVIMACARHITPRMSRRPVQPRAPYELPPAQDKRDPHHATAEGMRSMLVDGAQQPLWRALVGTYRGISPLAAREAAFRATGQADAPLAPELPWEQIAAAVRELWSAARQPCLVFQAAAPTTFAPYALTHLAPFEIQPSISVALDRFYTAHEQLFGHEQRRTIIREQLVEARERLDRQRRLLGEELARAQNLEQLRWEGEMIYGFLHAIRPGQTAIEVEGRSIALDPTHTPVENAQERFHAYDKAKGALAGVPERLTATEARLAGLDETLVLLDLAEGFEAIEGIAREATEQGYLRAPTDGRKRLKARRLPPLRIESSDGYSIYVGRSAGQNEQVTFKIAAPDDLWLHTRGMPGAHVVIKSGGLVVPEQTLLEAAALAAYYSSGRTEASVDVEVARRALVRRVPGGPPGLVTFRSERTIRAAPQDAIGQIESTRRPGMDAASGREQLQGSATKAHR